MKKTKILISLGIIVCFMLCSFTAACAETLAAPTDLSIDDDYTLTWTSVENARTYTISIQPLDGEEETTSTRKNYISLSGTSYPEGDYEIKVRAVAADGSSYKDSAWSEVYAFHKDFENGCVYTLINNSTEYEISSAGTATGDILIEDTYRGKPVTSIAEKAFRGKTSLTSVTIGANVRDIGASAFYNCTKLETVTFAVDDEGNNALETIGSSAFQGCRSLTEIAIPNGVETIEENTFIYCLSLTSIDLGSVVTILDSAFSNCTALVELVLPDTVETLGEYAFSGETNLEKVTFGSGLKTIGVRAFCLDSKLKTLIFAEDNNLSEICEYAFAYCYALEEIAFPDGLETIGDAAFYYATALETVTIPESVSAIGSSAFYGAKFYSDALTAGDEYIYADNWLLKYNGDSTELFVVGVSTLKSGVYGVANYAFSGSKIGSFIIPDSLKYIGEYSFYRCTGLYYVGPYSSTTSQLESIGASAFLNCTGLQSVVFNSGLKTIGSRAFYNCSLLDPTNVILPSSLEKIGSYAFNNTLTDNAYSDDGVLYAGNTSKGGVLWVVGSSSTVTEVALDSSTTGIADYAFSNKTTLMSVTGLSNSNLRYIGEGAFYKCSAYAPSTLYFSSNLKEIKAYTFYGCSSLVDVVFPRALTSIGRSAFYKCTSLVSVDLTSSSVTEIGDYAFYSDTSIKSISFGSSLKTIGNYAFYKNEAIEEITLPDTLTTIGGRAFAKCTSLTSVKFGNSLETIGDYAFNNCSLIESLDIPDSVVSIGNYAFYKNTSVTSLKLGSGLKSIGDYAFYGLENITSLHFPARLESIGKYAFKGCTGLKSITLPSSITTIGSFAFFGCKNITIYTDAKSLPANWSTLINVSYRPVVWGSVLSDDGSYVVSVTIGEDTFSNVTDAKPLTAPEREGYIFVGWTVSSDADVYYTAEELYGLPEGTTVYAIWTAVTSDEETEENVENITDGEIGEE